MIKQYIRENRDTFSCVCPNPVKLCYWKISLVLQLFQSVSMYAFLWGCCGPNNSSHWQLDWFLKLTKHAHCLVLQLRFFYHMFTFWGSNAMGTLRVLLRNSITRENSSIWQRSGNQGNQWIRASVPLNTSWRVTQVPQGPQWDVSVCIWMQRVRSFVRSLYKRALATITTTTKTPNIGWMRKNNRAARAART